MSVAVISSSSKRILSLILIKMPQASKIIFLKSSSDAMIYERDNVC